MCWLRILETLSKKLSQIPSFLYFSSDILTNTSMNWNLTNPLSGTRELPFQSAPDIELVVMKVRSIILRGVSLLMIFASWQNSVKALLETAHISALIKEYLQKGSKKSNGDRFVWCSYSVCKECPWPSPALPYSWQVRWFWSTSNPSRSTSWLDPKLDWSYVIFQLPLLAPRGVLIVPRNFLPLRRQSSHSGLHRDLQFAPIIHDLLGFPAFQPCFLNCELVLFIVHLVGICQWEVIANLFCSWIRKLSFVASEEIFVLLRRNHSSVFHISFC